MKLDTPHKFWKKYIEADYLERDKLLKVPTENLKLLINLLNDKTMKQKRYEKTRERLIKSFLKNYFDDLIETCHILK